MELSILKMNKVQYFQVVIAVSTRQDVSVPSAYTAELDPSSHTVRKAYGNFMFIVGM
jgi:hypothetical protein